MPQLTLREAVKLVVARKSDVHGHGPVAGKKVKSLWHEQLNMNIP